MLVNDGYLNGDCDDGGCGASYEGDLWHSEDYNGLPGPFSILHTIR